MCLQDLANGLRIDVDAFSSQFEIAAVALHEDGIFGPVVVFVFRGPGILQE
jgi:hypothetical protein